MAAEGFTKLPVHQSVGQLTTNLVPPGHAVEIVFRSQPQRPIEEFFLDAFQFLTLAVDAVIHLLDEARHSRHHVGTRHFKVLNHLGNALGIVGLVAHVLVEVVHHALVDVAEREKTHGTREMRLGRMFDTIHAGKDILMAEHNPFGMPCGARGINHRGHIASADRGLDGGQRIGLGIVAALLHQVGEGGIFGFGFLLFDKVDPLQRFQLGDNVLDLAQHGLILQEEVAHLAVLEDVAVVVLADGGINRNQHTARLLHAEVDEVPFRPVG